MTTDADIRAWARARAADVQRREFKNSLKVEPDKPLGSYGFSTPFRFFACAVGRYLRGRVPRHRDRDYLAEVVPDGTVWVYVWHEDGLARVFNEHLEVQQAAGWDAEPTLRAMVERIRREPVAPQTPLFDMISDCYGDKLSPGRTDVLPGVPRERLLDAYRELTGEPDPSGVYFDLARADDAAETTH